MIRLFSPPTRDLVLRPDAVTAANLLLHVAAVVALLVPLGKVAKEQLDTDYEVAKSGVTSAEKNIGSNI